MLVSRVMFASGLSLIAAGLVLAVVVSPLLGLIAVLGILDLVLARMFRTGRIGVETAGGESEAEASAGSEAETSVNPYARED